MTRRLIGFSSRAFHVTLGLLPELRVTLRERSGNSLLVVPHGQQRGRGCCRAWLISAQFSNFENKNMLHFYEALVCRLV